MPYLWIALGSAFGGVARFWLSGVFAQRFGDTFPWGTIFVNITGCFLIGLIESLTGLGGRWAVHPHARQFLMIGIMGGYTTFSSFSLQTLFLAQKGQLFYAAGNVVLSVVVCLVAVWLGYVIGTAVNR